MKYKINQKVGKNIKKYRKLRDISQEELADKVKIHYTTLSRIERGESNPPVQTIDKIAKALGVSTKVLFG